MNPYSTFDRHLLAEQCAFKAVQSGFRHLSIDDIRNPPHAWFDAALARQIAVTIMIREFDVPYRRIVAMHNRQRTSIHFAVQAVDRRRETPIFDQQYRSMVSHAYRLYSQHMEDAA
jgi:hypothetical protein